MLYFKQIQDSKILIIFSIITIIIIYYKLMLMNSNDIFSQIGLVVAPPNEFSEEAMGYTVYLEIELSQGKNQFLEINHFDEPSSLAAAFCRKHRLNELAKEIVQSKIREAQEKQQQRLFSKRNANNSGKLRKDVANDNRSIQKNNYIATNKMAAVDPKQNRSTQKQTKVEQRKTINNSPTKTKPSASNLKGKSGAKQIQKQSKPKKGNPNIGNQLYARAMIKTKMLEEQRQKRKHQLEQFQQSQLTFKPKINTVSSKIVQFRRENGDMTEKSKQKQNKKLAINQQKLSQEASQIKQCTFKPQINRVSQLIAQNKHTDQDEYDHFVTLYRHAQTKQNKINSQSILNQQKLFQPQINRKSTQCITETFQQRLQKSLIRKNQMKQGISDSQHSFKPKVGRPPKERSTIRSDSESSGLWDHLYNQKLKKSQTPLLSIQQFQPVTISQNSHAFYQNLVQKRVNDVFKILDSDEDGFISPDHISIELLSKNELIFLKPIFQQIDELSAVLDFTQFRKALLILLSEADPSSKGVFLSEKPKRQQRSNFIPEINKKSKQIALSRIHSSNVPVYEQLYEQGLKEMQQKQCRLQRQRSKLEQKQLQECSFKPQLANTSKYYIEKVLGKKFNDFYEDQPIN